MLVFEIIYIFFDLQGNFYGQATSTFNIQQHFVLKNL